MGPAGHILSSPEQHNEPLVSGIWALLTARPEPVMAGKDAVAPTAWPLGAHEVQVWLERFTQHADHLREDEPSQDEVGRRPALYVHRYEAMWRAQAHSQLLLHTLL